MPSTSVNHMDPYYIGGFCFFRVPPTHPILGPYILKAMVTWGSPINSTIFFRAQDSPAASGPFPSHPPRMRMDSPSSVAEWPFRPLGFAPITSVGWASLEGFTVPQKFPKKRMAWEVKETGKIINKSRWMIVDHYYSLGNWKNHHRFGKWIEIWRFPFLIKVPQ